MMPGVTAWLYAALPTSSIEECEKNKQYVKNSVDKTSFEKLNPCIMCKQPYDTEKHLVTAI